MTSDKQIAEMHTDIKWIKRGLEELKRDCKDRFAKKYVEKIVWLMTAGVGSWVIMQVLSLIQTAQAFFN